MTLEFLMYFLAAVLFGGMFLGLFLSYRETEAQRAKAAAATDWTETSKFYAWGRPDPASPEELILRRIEHHLRQEALLAEQFVMNPSPQTLRAGEYPGAESIH